MLNYYNTYTNNLLLLDMAEDDVETAKLNFRKSEELLESGQITSTQYRTAQLNFMRAMLRETQYKIQAKLSEIQLKKAAGMLIEE
jgi:outer membrane protein TolC